MVPKPPHLGVPGNSISGRGTFDARIRLLSNDIVSSRECPNQVPASATQVVPKFPGTRVPETGNRDREAEPRNWVKGKLCQRRKQQERLGKPATRFG